MALLPSVVLTLFFGIGSILKNNAGELPDQRLPLRTDGCYVNETLSRSYIDSSHYSFKQNVEWKDESYTTLTEVLSISYLWQPLVTLVSTVVFGLLFSFIVNLFKKPTKVKAKYMTPIILSIWIRILGVNRLSNWIDFDDSDDVDNQSDNTASVRNSISSESLHVSPILPEFCEHLNCNIFLLNRKGRNYRHAYRRLKRQQSRRSTRSILVTDL